MELSCSSARAQPGALPKLKQERIQAFILPSPSNFNSIVEVLHAGMPVRAAVSWAQEKRHSNKLPLALKHCLGDAASESCGLKTQWRPELHAQAPKWVQA